MSEWITHDGGLMPVAPEAIVDVKFRGKGGYQSRAARHWSWHHTRMADDIIAYRLAQPEPAAISERAIHWDAAKRIPLARDMTKRERFAMAAMQGLLSCPACSGDVTEFAGNAVKAADALLAALESNKGEPA